MTGGARRLGREIALELAAHGWDLALHYRSSATQAGATVQELRARGAEAQAFAADLADEAACRALLPAVQAHFGRLQAVVNNAALFEHDDVQSFSLALMERHWRANVAPAVLLAQALAPRVRVCGVAPGVTLPSGPMDQAGFEQAHRRTPLQRSSTAADIARAVRYLLEAPAITGTTLLVDGGQHLSHQARDVMFLK